MNNDNLNIKKESVKSFLSGRLSAVEDGYLSIFGAMKDKAPLFYFFHPGELDEAVATVAGLVKAGRDVYFAQGLLKEKPIKGRGTEADVSCILGLWFDCDILGGIHKETNLPTSGQAEAFFRVEIPFKPTQIISSGGGLHLHWLFSNPFRIRSEDDRKSIKDISSRFQITIIQKMKAHGWRQDNTSDLIRLLRVPGTINFKGDPVLVEVV